MVQFKVMGVQVHDARLVAAMQVNQMTHLLTLNPRDSARYASEGIVAIFMRIAYDPTLGTWLPDLPVQVETPSIGSQLGSEPAKD